MMKKPVFLATIAATLLAICPATWAADLSLDITNIKSADGNLLIAVWDSEDGFLSPDTIRYRGLTPAKEGTVTYVLHDIPPGDYAISVFHDADGDGKLKKNMMGIPREPLGMSRDAKGTFGPPAYEDAVFTLPEDGLTLTIRLK